MTAEPTTRARRRVRPVPAAALAELERRFRGDVVGPGHPSYRASRTVWNASIDRHPALVLRCRGTSDVVTAVRFARRAGMAPAVRGGGHSFAGLSVCDDGIVIDVSPMRRISVDPATRTVRAQAGVLLGELDAATQRFGLAVPTGSVTHTGLAGLTLGGGIGWLMRKHGLTVDSLLAVELVTAEGEVLVADEAEHPDLFWAVRGGGGNFGVVTSFRFSLHAVGPTVLSGLLLWPLDQAPQVVPVYRDWLRAVPDELTSALIARRAPAADPVPPGLRGRPVLALASCWAGPLERGRAVLEPLRHAGCGAVDLCAPRPFVAHQAMFDASFPSGLWVYSKAADVAALTDDVTSVLLGLADRVESARSAITVWQLGGAVARVGESATSFGGRSAGHLVDLLGATESAEGFDRERTWAREGWQALAPHRTGAYVNWLMAEGEAGVREAYGARLHRRLSIVKRRYDPENVFRHNQNIVPA